MMEDMRSRFITVEGGEGVGKSTFIRGLSDRLRGKGVSVVTTREPGGTKVADLIRGVFAAPIPDEPLAMGTEALLVSAARCQHVERLLKPSLKEGAWVLSDRFADSTRIYQGILGGIDAEVLESLIQFSTGGLEPDLTFLLDCPVSLSSQRLGYRRHHKAGGQDIVRYDDQNTEFHERLRRAYLQLAERFPQRVFVLDASKAPGIVIDHAWSILERYFG